MNKIFYLKISFRNTVLCEVRSNPCFTTTHTTIYTKYTKKAKQKGAKTPLFVIHIVSCYAEQDTDCKSASAGCLINYSLLLLLLFQCFVKHFTYFSPDFFYSIAYSGKINTHFFIPSNIRFLCFF